MKDGTITELGTHEELVSNDKDYNNLISSDQVKRKERDDKKETKSDKNDLPTNVRDLDNTLQPNKEVIGPTNITKEEKINNSMEDEGEILKYSSWAVLLEYFKVSYDYVLNFCPVGSTNVNHWLI
jgi:hypothetical protein